MKGITVMSEKEMITIFNSEYELIGTASREEAHKKGLWHETFHCWMYDINDDEVFLYFQQRSAKKKDFPNQLDITAAGHLLAGETVFDGFREVTEELGLEISPNSADCLGVFPVQIHLEDFYDNEFTNVFIVKKKLELGTFVLQEEEVSAVYAIPLKKLKELFSDTRKELAI
ncbi:NUDIX hydrolase [Enterococcus rivorum]|uniref:NUDIX hydrolase n=2 Tax=Enterococcus rivorum TaxID=762845 RepID=UPI000A07AE7C|nr:NUDIX domain-containing protein [Enterococcus rivorum]